MEKDFDMEEERESRILNEGGGNLNLDLNLNDGVEGFSGYDLNDPKTEFDQVRVLPEETGDAGVLGGYHGNGDSREVDGGGFSVSSGGVDGDGGIVGKGENFESGGDVELGENETGKTEISDSEVEKSGKVDEDDSDIVEAEVSGSGKMGKGKLDPGLSSRNDFRGEGEGEGRGRGVLKDEGLDMDGREEDFKLESRGDLGAPLRKKVCGVDIDGSLMRSVSAKVMGTEFGMGDMVWGKVKSHPGWPGHLYNEAFASSSVRRSRRDGNILVAFFGDSSYGWFDPDELVPYDPHYAEKSQQTSSRNFARAVEESVDEASRRSALGLSCYCRNPYNFRPTNVPGYLAVDIADFEPGSVYSVSQIQKARDSFRPAEALSFIHQLAAVPMGTDSKSLDFIKNKATALAYRRSTFKEFDMTYAEAFGQKAVPPPLPSASTIKEPSRAPLSGPLVFADTVGGRKSSTKATKPKDHSKKDRYLFKRRDESNDSRTTQIIQSLASPSSSSANEDGTSDSAAAGYVFQKRDQAASNGELGESSVVDQLTTSYPVISGDAPAAGHTLTSVPQHPEAGDVQRGFDKHIKAVTSSEAGNLAASGSLLKKKKKPAKRPASDWSSEKPERQEKKLKKQRKAEKGRLEHPESHSDVPGGASPVSPVGRFTEAVPSIRDDTQATHWKKDAEATNSAPQQAGLVPLATEWETGAEVRQILADLHYLALNPFHGKERNALAIARQFFLNFRSLVYLKSGTASAAESEQGEARFTRSPGAEFADRPPTESSKSVSSLKAQKFLARQDDPTKKGRKRIPSERQDENATKRARKITDAKASSMENTNKSPPKNVIFEEKQEFMVPPTKTSTGVHPLPIKRTAHFLKPIYNPNKILPKPPSLSLSNHPNIDQRKNVGFYGRQPPQENWDTWVDKLQQTHQNIWKKVGIFDAIRASTYVIKSHDELIIGLADKWCAETNTFVFRFGEATITLEDVMILGGFSVLGECVRTPVRYRDFVKIKKNMLNHPVKSSRFIFHRQWMENYMGIGGEIEHIAFLVLWLSRYVFPTKYYGYITPNVLPIALKLVRGTRIALAPAVLAAIYRDLRLLKEFVNDGEEVCSLLKLPALFQLVQLWVWERFPMLGPEPALIPDGELRLARWRNLDKVKVGCLRFNIEPIDGLFVWRPYVVCIENWRLPHFYSNEGRMVFYTDGGRMLLNSENGMELLSFGKCLRNCELIGMDCIEQYLPHRVGMQFGMDQDVPSPVSRLNQAFKLAWDSYHEPFDGVMLYLPPKSAKGDVSLRYFEWWRNASYEMGGTCSKANVDDSSQNCVKMQMDCNPIIIDENDDDADEDIEALIVLISEFEGKIRELETEISKLQAAEVHIKGKGNMRRMELRRKRSNQGDRLPNLPDEILTRILGMLPIKNAVALTLMFNKFMRAFSALRNLDLDISHVSGGNPREHSLNFWKFVEYVFENCKSKQLGRFRLSYCYPKERKVVGPRQRPRPRPGHVNPALETVRVNAWISFPLARRVRELDICIHVGEPLPKLPMSSIIKCPTLEVLKIDANLELDVDYVLVSPVVNLPHLKLLHLRSLLINEDSFVTALVQLCPKLEDLLVDCRWERCFVVDIGSTSLRSLVLSVNKCYGRISSYSVVINTPNLECLKYEDNIALHYSVSDMTALVQAEFTIRPEFKLPSEKEAFEHLCTVLSSTSHVSQLSLLYCSAVCLDHRELKNKLPVFQNLNHLELGYYRRTSWHNVLMVLLNHSPLLETLIFAEGIVSGDDIDIDESDLWRRTREIPFCCKSHLKHIAIKQYFGIQRKLDLVQFLLGKTLYLETLVVWRSELANSDQDKVSMKNTLEQLPKASTFCSIIVHPSVIA